MRFKVIIISLLAFWNVCAYGQNFSVSTNIMDWAEFITMNLEAGTPLSQHWSIHSEVRINPWKFGAFDSEARYEDILENKKAFLDGKTAINFSVRWWSWHVYSGWWVRGKLQYMSYDRGGLVHEERTVGDAFGLGIGGGYSWMLSEHWNVEAGFSVWGGYTSEFQYPTVNDPHRSDTYGKGFFLPDQVLMSVAYIF